MARRLGLDQALGSDFAGQLALWQVIARLLDQGSRLSAVRLAQTHAACDVLGIRRGFDENDLYENLTWLCHNQERIERRLFSARRGQRKPELFRYDVTSSYLEGEDQRPRRLRLQSRRQEKQETDRVVAAGERGKTLKLVTDEAERIEAGRLDGCYVLKTDLPEPVASKQVVRMTATKI